MPEAAKMLFATGMFRSGTTLLARLLASHPKLAFASDPFAPLFKSFRNAVARQVLCECDLDPSAPLDDYYFSEQKQNLFWAVQRASLNMSTSDVDLDALRTQIAKHAQPYSPRVIAHLAHLKGESFAGLLSSGLQVVRDAYGDGSTQVVGFKEVWIGEFTSHLLASFPTSKVIHLVRDPRAVAASKNARDAKYPWLFLARQWRKLAALAWVAQNTLGPHAERVLVMRYEDLVANPERSVRAICCFAEIEFTPELLDARLYQDGDGQPWYQNSTHFEHTRAFNPQSLDKWREILTPPETAFIEHVCAPEMTLFGYLPDRLGEEESSYMNVMSAPHLEPNSLAEWIKPYCPEGPDDLMREMSCEFVRRYVLRNPVTLDTPEKRRLCLSETLFDHLQMSHGNVIDAHQQVG